MNTNQGMGDNGKHNKISKQWKITYYFNQGLTVFLKS